MTGVGVDNVLISRFEKTYEKFAKRILSEREYSYYQIVTDKITYVASRFAAKEAYIKASNNKCAKLQSIEVINDDNGKPHIYYEGLECGMISITHDTIATAIVILI